jgi:hypothetical protein
MEIRPSSNIDSVARVINTAPKASRPVDSEPDVSAFENSRALETQLTQLPDVRPEKVDDAKRLIGDPAYPPRVTIQRIATLLAIKNDNTQE